MATNGSNLAPSGPGEATIPAHIKDVELEPKVEAIESLLQKGSITPQRIIAFFICLFGLGMVTYHLFTGAFGGPEAFAYRTTHVSFLLVLTFLLYPTGRKSWKEKLNIFFLLDAFIIVFVIYAQAYIYRDIEDLPLRAIKPNFHDMIVGAGIYFLVVEATRRTVGLPMALVALFFSLHALYASSFPGLMHGIDLSFNRFVGIQFLEMDGIYGIPIAMMALYVVLFILYGSILGATKATNVIVDLAISLTGWMTAGPAKQSCVSSALFGTISGSAVANVAVDGVFNIPMMKKVGFSGEEAAGIEAVTSSGGQIMPPVMGATAFVMAGILGVTYGEVCLRAAFPAILYYVSLFFVVHFIGKRRGMKGVSRSELPQILPTLKNGITLLSIVFLIGLLIAGYQADYAVFWAIVAVLVISFFSRSNRVTPTELLSSFIDGTRVICSVGAACACAGVIVASVTYSGLGMHLTGALIELSHGQLWLALVLTMIVALILGMGMTTTAVYITLAVLIIPAIIKMGVLPMAAHMFCFYFGVISNITPPVAVAAFAAAGIARTNPMRTGLEACKIGCVAFLIPYMFVYGPEVMLIGKPLNVLQALVTATLGALALGAGVGNFFLTHNRLLERLALLAAAFLLIKPGWVSDLFGLVLIAAVLLRQSWRLKNAKTTPARI
jgi:TRAP transporter 4TM/12TM fusion protein